MAWKKGQSGNPGGRPKEIADLKSFCQEKSPVAMAKVASLVESADERIALAASQTILDRAFGKPAQTTAHTGPTGEGPIEHKIEVRFVRAQD